MIKMIAGVFGLRVKQPNGGSRIVGMGPNDGPFSVDPEREAELVAKGIARYVEPPVVEDAEGVEDNGHIGFDETPPVGEAVTVPEYSVEMKATELREIGAQFGLSFKVGMTKAEMVAALDAHFAEGDTEGEAVEDAEGAEDAPTFDASEAVL